MAGADIATFFRGGAGVGERERERDRVKGREMEGGS